MGKFDSHAYIVLFDFFSVDVHSELSVSGFPMMDFSVAPKPPLPHAYVVFGWNGTVAKTRTFGSRAD